jgi:ribosomal protein S18 acetylase RimI-like enzyme
MIIIEDIQRKHIRNLHEVIDTVSREKKYLAWTEAPPLGIFKVFVINGIVKRNPHVVALENGKVIGWCDITALTRPTTKHCGVLGMGVLPAYRHAGVGTRLVHAALKKAKAYGLYRVELEVFEDNLPAIELYTKVGFKVEGRKIGAVRIGDRYVNAFVMALLLQDYSAAIMSQEYRSDNGVQKNVDGKP